MMQHKNNKGFTLIEMSIVLAVIGLIVGGVLVGQELIKASTVRATISQVEKFNTAVNTFYGKYGALPGDMNLSTAQANGFATAGRGTGQGQGDGNGIVERDINLYPDRPGIIEGAGETAMFWSDLTYANGLNLNLIEGSFSTASESVWSYGVVDNIAPYLPAAKIGRSNYFYVWSGGIGSGLPVGNNGMNYYGISVVSGMMNQGILVNGSPSNGTAYGLSVSEAYNIDRKIDDGFPTSGRVLAMHIGGNEINWAGLSAHTPDGGWGIPAPSIFATPGDYTTCFDNDNISGANQHYSTEVNGGNTIVCALSFQFQ